MALTDKQLKALDACPCLKELKDWIIAIDNEDEPALIKKYYFISYGDSQGEEELARGTVKTTGVTSGNYTQVVVTSNVPYEEFVGNKYYIISTAKTDGTLYVLYEGAGSSSTGMYVKVSESPFPAEEEDND